MPRPPRTWPLYAGGFLGPFGGAMVNTMLPELAAGTRSDVASAASSVTTYMLPFAILMVASGTVARRWGTVRTIRLAYVVYAVASVVCVLASTLVPFLAGRVLQGAANAFTSPLLVVVIAATVPGDRLGRSLGTYASCQAAGQAFAPFVGGLAAAWDYRVAFGASAVVALALAATTASASGSERESAPWRPLLNRRLARSAGVAACSQLGATATMLFVGLLASDRFGMPPTARGLVVAAFGVAGLLGGRALGRLGDRLGLRTLGIGCLTLVGIGGLVATAAPWAVVLVLGTAAVGLGATGGRVVTNTLAMASTPANRSGATSLSMAAQFLGASLAPLLLPLYHSATGPVVAGAAVLGIGLVGAALASLRPTSG